MALTIRTASLSRTGVTPFNTCTNHAATPHCCTDNINIVPHKEEKGAAQHRIAILTPPLFYGMEVTLLRLGKSYFNLKRIGWLARTAILFPFYSAGFHLGINLTTRTASASNSGETPLSTCTSVRLPSSSTTNVTMTLPDNFFF